MDLGTKREYWSGLKPGILIHIWNFARRVIHRHATRRHGTRQRR